MLLVKVGIGFISEKKEGGGKEKEIASQCRNFALVGGTTLESLYVCVLYKQWGLGSFISSIIKPVSYIRVLCLLIISQTTTKGKSSQTGKHKMSRDTPTTVPLSLLLSPASGSTSFPVTIKLHS